MGRHLPYSGTPEVDHFQRKFWSRVDVRGPSKCWEWTGPTDPKGYGRLGAGKLAHRIAWVEANGPIPPLPAGQRTWAVMHTCDNPPCVNPAHLVLGTIKENNQDMARKGRWGERKLPVGEDHGNAKLTDEQVIAIRQSTQSNTELAELYGVTNGTIEYARKYGWKHIKVRAKKPVSGKVRASQGANNKNSRLTDDDIRAIRASVDKPGIVAQRFGIIPDYVTMIRKRKVWKHVA
jgi:hypothetical protein